MTGTVKLRADRHAESLASGRMLAPGEVFDRADLDDADQWLVDEGHVIDAVVAPDPDLKGDDLQERAAALEIEGRSTMSAAKLRKAVADAEARHPEIGSTAPEEGF